MAVPSVLVSWTGSSARGVPQACDWCSSEARGERGALPAPVVTAPWMVGLARRRGSRLVGLPETELVALGVLADREPAHAGNRQGLTSLPAELLHARAARVDVVDVEVDARSAFVRGIGHVDRAARRLGEPGHVVLRRAAGERLPLPAEERAPELARLGGVARWNLEVY